MYSHWHHYTYETKLGSVVIHDDGIGVNLIEWEDCCREKRGSETETEVIAEAAKQIREYLDGKRKEFRLALRIEGTAFQLKVWKALRKIPYGTVVTYGEVAKMIGQPGAGRAVGAANNRNRLPMIIPCHRVVGVHGKLTGYAGGIERKTQLLELEGLSVSGDHHVILPEASSAMA